ncbi:MAG: nucleoside-diphosphate kinase [Chthoniobacterales bacterium]
MAEELSYVLITPHSLKKSRTGGIIARLVSRSGLEVVAGRMFAPSSKFIAEYANHIVTESDPRHRATQELLKSYLQQHFSPSENGTRQRCMLLVLRGEDAAARVLEVSGHIVHGRMNGETIRDTYGDYVLEEGGIRYFEPAVFTAPNAESAKRDLEFFAHYSDSDGGIIQTDTSQKSSDTERTLVLIKPDNFRFPNARMGHVIDTFSRAGLQIIALKIHHMSVAQAEKFYGPVLDVLQDVFKEPFGRQARKHLENELEISLDADFEKTLGEKLGPICGRKHWENIIHFMAGRRPSDCTPEEKTQPGTEKCAALIYEGPRAIEKIRSILGSTDPSKASPGSIRKEFGQSMMVNAAHASDSVENAQREMKIINIEENNFKTLILTRFKTTQTLKPTA